MVNLSILFNESSIELILLFNVLGGSNGSSDGDSNGSLLKVVI